MGKKTKNLICSQRQGFSRENLFYFILFFFLVFLDQITKFFANRLRMTSINQGVAFGFNFFNDRWLLFSLIMVLIVGFFIFFKKLAFRSTVQANQKSKLTSTMIKLAAVLFLAGAISNLIDRVFFSGVRDFLPVPFFNLKNNLADYFIVLGLALWWGSMGRDSAE
ncbi:MAG: signal peptidase II [Candidatus Woesebacteria bacterium]|jgi:lipoprotein signal peptidase